mmetsp:Transcript_63424/g.120139  ORF Transcript_63424/g.120139 Transcript_63424/m.120139 type:complete len:170 (-) Transcript_63424:106-615(-)
MSVKVVAIGRRDGPGCLVKMLDFKTRCSLAVMTLMKRILDPRSCKVICHYPGTRRKFTWLKDKANDDHDSHQWPTMKDPTADPRGVHYGDGEWARMKDPSLLGMQRLFAACDAGHEKACNANADPALRDVFGEEAEQNNPFYLKHGTSHHQRAAELNYYIEHLNLDQFL